MSDVSRRMHLHMRRCFVKPSEPASNLFKIGAILWNRLQDVMGLWWCVCVCGCIYAAFLFSVVFSHSQAIKMKRWNNFVAKLALDKRVDFEEGDIGLPGGAPSRRMHMPWASYAYFTSNGAQWFHQSNHCSPFCPYFVHLPWQSSGLRVA